ncbi:MAG: hypothetical protein U0X75_18695 [Acidobacteriota bacterium]
MFRPGRRLFSIAAICLVLTAAAHTMGHFQPPPTDAATTNLLTTIENYKISLGLGMNPSYRNITDSLSLFMSIALLFWGVQNLLLAKLDHEGRILRSLTLLNIVWVGAVAILFWRFQILPAVISMIVTEAFLVLSWLLPAPRKTA